MPHKFETLVRLSSYNYIYLMTLSIELTCPRFVNRAIAIKYCSYRQEYGQIAGQTHKRLEMIYILKRFLNSLSIQTRQLKYHNRY